uniref:Uncharacterized protein n=1 Tax=Noctiluca scintillans TaxID=2966 RepID=A0A7S1AVY0_NOCSC|mmetsp:Transcript_62493/g.165828  ORF Transcript_62493/g.165828 Transcript_62493/m.165828 type:complete len:329 (+) Transcript_62493:208-1194(+)
MADEKIKEMEVLNRSRKDRLMKAAKQGYGPWAELLPRSRPLHQEEELRRSTSHAGGSVRGCWSSVQAQRKEIRDAHCEARQAQHAPRREEEEPDLRGFLAPKRPGTAQKSQSTPPKLEVRISSDSSVRAMAASSGARPKASSRASCPEKLESDERQQRSDSKVAEESSEEEEERVREDRKERDHRKNAQRQSEKHKHRHKEKRKREEWRKAWQERKRRSETAEDRDDSGERGRASTSASDRESAEAGEDLEARHRAQMWRVLNSNGASTGRENQRKYVGQLSDYELHKRLKEEEESSSSNRKLMSEAEVLAKLQKARSQQKPRGLLLS